MWMSHSTNGWGGNQDSHNNEVPPTPLTDDDAGDESRGEQPSKVGVGSRIPECQVAKRRAWVFPLKRIGGRCCAHPSNAAW